MGGAYDEEPFEPVPASQGSSSHESSSSDVPHITIESLPESLSQSRNLSVAKSDAFLPHSIGESQQDLFGTSFLDASDGSDPFQETAESADNFVARADAAEALRMTVDLNSPRPQGDTWEPEAPFPLSPEPPFMTFHIPGVTDSPYDQPPMAGQYNVDHLDYRTIEPGVFPFATDSGSPKGLVDKVATIPPGIIYVCLAMVVLVLGGIMLLPMYYSAGTTESAINFAPTGDVPVTPSRRMIANPMPMEKLCMEILDAQARYKASMLMRK